MIKKLSKSITALILVACMAFSSVIASAASVSDDSSVGGIVADIAIDKLVEVGMRVAAEACSELGEATGVEEIENYCSFISSWVFSSGAEAGIAELEELCVSISDQIEELEKETKDDLSVVEHMLAQQTKDNSADALAARWEIDVDELINDNSEGKGYHVYGSVEAYKNYLKSAINYHNEQNGLPPVQTEPGEEIDTPEEALKKLISAFNKMNLELGGADKANAFDTFTKEKVTNAFQDLITDLSNNLYKPADGTHIKGVTVLDAAFQCAYDAYGFSHEQYEFVFNYAEKQILNLILVCMVYNEYLYQQGTFIENYNYPDESERIVDYNSFLNYQKEFHEILIKKVKPQITNMLNSEVVVNGSQKLSLDTCMKPEDAEAVNLNITDYERVHKYGSHSSSSTEYISDVMRFNRVMTQTNNKMNVYYILDPDQFTTSDATKVPALDYKDDRSYAFDVHYPSADYLNLTQTKMSDGANIFSCSADIFELFNTNAFRLYGSKPSSYLGSYLSEGIVLIMTPEYDAPKSDGLFGTAYEHFDVIEANSQYPGTKIEPKDYSAETFQPDKDGDKYSYSVILKNTEDVYKQTATLNIPAHLNVSLSDSKGNEIIEPTEAATPSAKITSGEKITFKFKVEDGYKIESLNCIRNNSTQSTTLLFDYDDLDILQKDGDYYTFTYPMPYSDSTFDFKVVPVEDEYNIWTAEDLINFSNDMNNGVNSQAIANLCADIDMSGYDSQFSPIGNAKYPYCGTFNGNNHKIYGLNIADDEYCGLFGHIKSGAVIKDFTVSGDITVERSLSITRRAGVVCYADGGHLENIISNLNFYQDNVLAGAYCGGIVGVANNNTEIESCMYCGTMKFTGISSEGLGGIVGCSESGALINNCSNVGSVLIVDSFVSLGGIIGNIDDNDTSITNCYNYAKFELSVSDSDYEDGIDVGTIIGYGYLAKGVISNNYYLDDSRNKVVGYDEDSNFILDLVATSKTSEQFASGEVAYLLNNKVTDGYQAWYQNLDNGLTPDSYPILKNNGKNTVYKVDLEDKDYSNTDASVEPTEPTTEPVTEPTEPVTVPTEPVTEPTEPVTVPTEPVTEPTEPVTVPTEPVTEPTEPVTVPTEPDSKVSALDKDDLRVYHRVLNNNKTVDGRNSLITYGRGEVDNDAKIITICTYEKVSKIGILKYQGNDSVKGTMSLVGYEPLSVTSKDIIDNNPLEEPKIYVDKNGCIFIDPNSDTSKLELEYKQNDTDSVTYEPVRYKVKIKFVDFSRFKLMGSVSSEKHYEISDINEDPTTDATIPTDATQPTSQPDASSTTDEAKTNTNSTASQNDSVKTGNVANVMIPITLLISAFVCLYIYRLKKIK